MQITKSDTPTTGGSGAKLNTAIFKHTADEGGGKAKGKACKNYRGAIVLLFLSLSVSSLFVDLQINPFRPSPNDFVTGSQGRIFFSFAHQYKFHVKIFSRSALVGFGGEKFFIGVRNRPRRP